MTLLGVGAGGGGACLGCLGSPGEARDRIRRTNIARPPRFGNPISLVLPSLAAPTDDRRTRTNEHEKSIASAQPRKTAKRNRNRNRVHLFALFACRQMDKFSEGGGESQHIGCTPHGRGMSCINNALPNYLYILCKWS